MSTDAANRISLGRSFHSLGACTVRERRGAINFCFENRNFIYIFLFIVIFKQGAHISEEFYNEALRR